MLVRAGKHEHASDCQDPERGVSRVQVQVAALTNASIYLAFGYSLSGQKLLALGWGIRSKDDGSAGAFPLAMRPQFSGR
jgi:hypothetical protein